MTYDVVVGRVVVESCSESMALRIRDNLAQGLGKDEKIFILERNGEAVVTTTKEPDQQ